MIYLRGRSWENGGWDKKNKTRKSEEDKEESVDKRRNRISIDTYIQSRRECSADARWALYSADHHQRRPFRRSLSLVGDSRDEMFYGAGIDCGYINQPHDFQKIRKPRKRRRIVKKKKKKKQASMYVQTDIDRLFVLIRISWDNFSFRQIKVLLYFIFRAVNWDFNLLLSLCEKRAIHNCWNEKMTEWSREQLLSTTNICFRV